MILRTFTRKILHPLRKLPLRPIDVTVCIDIECTCDSPVQLDPMEVIEIACLKMDLTENSANIEATSNQSRENIHLNDRPSFHTFVRPVINPELTLFCQELTGVFQSTVDKASTIDVAIDKLITWLQKENLVDENYAMKREFTFASCGNFDLNLLSPLVKKHRFNNDSDLPIYFKEWINVKKTFLNHKKEWPKTLYHMLEILGEEPSGRLHSAMDDCKNLARIVECLHSDGCKFHVTNRSERPGRNNNVNNQT